MIVLALGVVLFAALHLVAAVPGLKASVQARTGRRYHGMVFGVVSVVALGLMVLGWRMSAWVPAYEIAAWGWIANFILTFVAFQFLAIFLFRGQLRQRVRFPMGIAVIFWATGHLLANGDWASVILFGGLLIYAVLHIALGLFHGVRPTAEVRGGHDILALLAGMTLYAAMTQLHPVVTGVPVLTLVK